MRLTLRCTPVGSRLLRGLAPGGWPRRGLWLAVLGGAAASAAVIGCRETPPEPTSRPPRPAPSAEALRKAPAAPAALALPANDDGSWRRPAAARVIAIGDVHGDLGATRRALRRAGAIDEQDHWSGGDLVVVQTGDQLDRGPEERQILDLFVRLEDEAQRAGGAFLVLNGNHETLNVEGDYRYVLEEGWRAFQDVQPSPAQATLVARFPAAQRGRAAAFLPGGSYAQQLSARPVVLAVGDSLFAHGAVLPEHVSYGFSRMNAEGGEWMRGVKREAPAVLRGEDAPVWSRSYSAEQPTRADCARLERVLAATGTKRLVVGHTVQKQGINSACEGKVWRIDTGMSAYYEGPTQVLELTSSGGTRVLDASARK